MTGLFPDAPQVVTMDDQIKCAERELGFRQRVYPRQVQDNKMSEGFATHQLQCQEAIIETLKRCKERGEIATRIANRGR